MTYEYQQFIVIIYKLILVTACKIFHTLSHVITIIIMYPFLMLYPMF